MCLTITRKKTFWEYFTGYKPEIANEDIIVYKSLTTRYGEYFSEMQNYHYAKNLLQPKVTLKINNKYLTAFVDSGYHCFSRLEHVQAYKHLGDSSAICEFIIPKGTKFYRGHYEAFENLVAETIIFKGEYNENN